MPKFSSAEEAQLEKLSAKLRLTYSQRRLSQTYIYEINRRENISVDHILKRTDQTDRKVFLQSLFEQRFPETSQLIKNGKWKQCSPV